MERNHEGGSCKRSHEEGIWRTSERHLGVIWEASGIWESFGPRCARVAVDPRSIVQPCYVASCFYWFVLLFGCAREARGFGKRRA